MSYKKIVGAVIFTIIINFTISLIHLKDVYKLVRYVSQFKGEEKILEVERYNGYDNVVQFVKNGDALGGNSVVINAVYDYSERFTEFFNYSYLSSNKVFYAPFHVALKEDFIRKRFITKMIILTDEGVIVHARDSLFESSAHPISSDTKGDTVVLRWIYPNEEDLILYVSDIEGRIVYKRIIPKEISKESFYETSIPLKSMNLEKGLYYWTVSKQGYSKFMSFSGRLKYD